jgi:heme exporter protein A
LILARLAFEHVACLRGERLLFEDISFALAPGEAALLTGPNGAGKVDREGGIAFAGEAAALDARLPLGKALLFWAKLDGVGPAEVEAALAMMGIANLAQVPVRMLSTGQRKRAALARVIAGTAAIWLLDEPGNGLDTAALDRLGTAMAAHRARGGIVMAATHQPLALPGAVEIPLGAAR